MFISMNDVDTIVHKNGIENDHPLPASLVATLLDWFGAEEDALDYGVD